MNYNAATDPSPDNRAAFIEWLTQVTLAELKEAQGNSLKLQTAVQQFLTKATAANIDLEDIENIFGVNEPSIMDLAALSEEDEEILIDAFENLVNN
jgi:hypothetical protein